MSFSSCYILLRLNVHALYYLTAVLSQAIQYNIVEFIIMKMVSCGINFEVVVMIGFIVYFRY